MFCHVSLNISNRLSVPPSCCKEPIWVLVSTNFKQCCSSRVLVLVMITSLVSSHSAVGKLDHSLTIHNVSTATDTAMYTCLRRRRSHGNNANSSASDDVMTSRQIQLVVQGRRSCRFCQLLGRRLLDSPKVRVRVRVRLRLRVIELSNLRTIDTQPLGLPTTK